MNQTPLHKEHLKLGAKMVDFAGWEMPLHYGSQLNEHQTVRSHAGMFDVSHMTIVDIKGQEAQNYLRYLLANDVAKLTTAGKALYSCMLNEQGGVIDDLIVYYLTPDYYLMIVNAATRDKDLAWLQQQAKPFKVEITERPDLAMIAVQGPQAQSLLEQALPTEQAQAMMALKPFYVAWLKDRWIARTGYTGENGYEILLPANEAAKLWQDLLNAGVKPAGLGARDTLRLEAGMNLYGTDMDESVTPLESNLGWTVAWEPQDRDFIGRKALTTQREQGVPRQLVYVVLTGKGVVRNHQKVMVHDGVGEITSGSFSPVLQKGIGFARVPMFKAAHCQIEIRGEWQPAQIIKGPFVRAGKIIYEPLESQT
ncbi:MAG: glycine cleavage system aminomethyltransferase GcvT [Gammaproteobacteria bacterium]